MSALALCAAFLILSVAGRIAMQYRFAGDHGIRMPKRRSALLISVQTLLAFSTIGIFVVTCLQFADLIRPQTDLGAAGNLVGLAVGLIGIAITVVAQYQMGASWRIGVEESESTDLITHGLYARVRNPIYSGMMTFGLGLLILIPHLYMAVTLAAGYVSIELHVRKVEEPYLRRHHGTVYATYFSGTGRYLPNFKRHRD